VQQHLGHLRRRLIDPSDVSRLGLSAGDPSADQTQTVDQAQRVATRFW
jgi:hypothetical protein